MSFRGTVGATTLTVEQLASHGHSSAKRFGSKFGGGGLYGLNGDSGGSFSTLATGGSQPHTHTLSGASGETNGLPPYYALAYIMRTS